MYRILQPKNHSIWINLNRSYHQINGVFGNYCPYRLNDLDRWMCDVENSATYQLPPTYQLIKRAFQKRGHLATQIDPLGLSNYGSSYLVKENLTDESLFKLGRLLGVDLLKILQQSSSSTVDLKDYIRKLSNIYCGNIGYEFAHLISLEEIDWFEKQIENGRSNPILNNSEDKTLIAKKLLLTEAFDHFLAKKFQSVKRYGCEGAETMVVLVEEIIEQLLNEQKSNVDEIIIGMPHRGRLNLMINTLRYPLEALFHKLSGKPEFDISSSAKSSIIGDVLSHLYTTTQFDPNPSNTTNAKKKLRVTILPNPSHLEVASPVICGYARGHLLHHRLGPYNCNNNDKENCKQFSKLPLQIHGDAAFSGQGIVMETLALANVEHFTVGGSIHLVVNNQVGYTTPGRIHQARSSFYCTDPLKMIEAPIIHVNGDHPESVIHAARLAVNYRQTFHKDVAIDLVCFRRWGHNELDDPTFTNPRMYEKIKERKSIPKQYVDEIQLAEDITKQILDEYNASLNEAMTKAYRAPSLPSLMTSNPAWKNIEWPSGEKITKWDTGVCENLLRHIGEISITPPDGFQLHLTLKKVFNDRQTKLNSGKELDWALAESLAFGSLLYQGHDIRISGQDVGRGTFSQRHVMIVDQATNDVFIPLNELANDHSTINEHPYAHASFGQIEVCNSILSEEGVMAFEYGLSISNPQTLVIWEAQFGDFFNGAQVIIDTLVSSGEDKWLLPSSLTLLLPNGWDGAGPEHTSGRLERFLQLSNSSETDIDSDNVNWSVVYPTTPAQYFHLLSRQMNRPFRKPMVVMSPKMLLRHPRCVSTIKDLSGHRSHFKPVLDDPKYYPSYYNFQSDPIQVGKPINSVYSLIFCSGKHYYTLQKEQEDRGNNSIAIIRLEELCPFPSMELVQIFKRYPNAKNLIWSQEEHRNMGAWTFVEPRFRNILKRKLKYVGRGPLEAPAVGIGQLHKKQTDQLVRETFEMCGKK